VKAVPVLISGANQYQSATDKNSAAADEKMPERSGMGETDRTDQAGMRDGQHFDRATLVAQSQLRAEGRLQEGS
jgi:hypothetical protein